MSGQMIDIGSAPVLDADPYSREVLTDPYPFFEALRETGPVCYLPKYNAYAVGRHTVCSTVLSDFARFTGASGVGLADARDGASGARPRSALLEIDPPDRGDVRIVAQRLMGPGVTRKWRTDFDVQADRIVMDALDRPIDGVEDLIEHFVHTVFFEAMGLRFDRGAIRAIGYMSFNQSGPHNEFYDAGMAAGSPYLQWFDESCQRHNVVPGSLSDTLFDAEERGEFAPGIASNIIRSFVRGGTDSTISGICSLINQLGKNPDQWALLKAEPTLLRTAFDEAIRMESPFHVTYRMVNSDTDLDGVRVEGQRKIGVYPGAANHDPRRWDRPDKFDLRRKVAGQHLSFGTAEHNCIGQMIARQEAESLLAALLRHVAAIEPIAEATYEPINQMRMIKQMPIRLRSS